MRTSTRDRVWFATGLALVATASVVYAVDPTGWGGTARGVMTLVIVAVVAAGPLLRGARPLRIWLFECLGGVFLCGAMLASAYEMSPISVYGVLLVLAYSSFAIWLLLLCRPRRHRLYEGAVLDTAATAAGACLVMWGLALAPILGRDHLLDALGYVLSPLFDVVVITLAAHLALRVGLTFPPLAWFLGGMVALGVVDTALALLHSAAPGRTYVALDIAMLFGHFALAVGAAHPRVVELASAAALRVRRPSRSRPAAHIVFTISPAVLAAAVPVVSPLDAAVQGVLVTALLVVVYVRLTGALGALSDAEAGSRHRATHDDLTGLPNRIALLQSLRRAPSDGRRAVFFLDCDDFKYVNDTWGHRAGDRVLHDIGRRLISALGSGAFVARHGADEFVVTTTVSGPEDAEDVARRLTALFEEPLRIRGDRSHVVTMSIGIAVAPAATPADDPDGEVAGVATGDLLLQADTARHEAKRRGRGLVVLFDDELGRRSRLRTSVGARLEQAIRSEAFTVALQPVMGGPGYTELVGWEALARWTDPELGPVPPDVFIPLAEQLGVVGELGELVLHLACRDLARLREAGAGEARTVFVNVSPTQLATPGFADLVPRVAAEYGLPPAAVGLEVTETILLDGGENVRDTWHALRAAGITLSLDDFGTGYAALTTLLRLPVDRVKLDRSLVQHIATDVHAKRRLTAVVALVRSLGIERLVAEGVEEPEQAAVLDLVGCPLAQGWLFGRPAPVSDHLAAVTA